jgi:hypothetical protein
MDTTYYALSIKQPWAALVVAGLKTIEIRTWPTGQLGRVFIHAARIPDDCEHAWASVPNELLPLTKLVGGLIGQAELIECITYRDAKHFGQDQAQHYNLPEWFQAPVMFGFRFANAKRLPFTRLKGQLRFFEFPASILDGLAS